MKAMQTIPLALVIFAVEFHPGVAALAQTNPVAVGQATNLLGVCIAVSGHYAYVGGGGEEGSLHIYDFSNPTAPVKMSSTNSSYVTGIAVRGSYAYLACGYDGLRIYDVSNPANPSNIGHAIKLFDGTNADSSAVALSGNYAYLSCDFGGLGMFDISDPSHPIDVGLSSPAGGQKQGVAVRGNYCYVAGSGLDIFDISDPTHAFRVGWVYRPNANVVALADHFAYMGSIGGFWIVDISNPAMPIEITNVDNFAGWTTSVAVSGNYLYLAKGSDGLRIYDVSNPLSPTEVGSAPAPNASGFSVSGSYGFLANGTDGLRIYSLGTPSSPPLRISADGANTLVLSWPTPTPSFALQQNTDLQTVNWVTLTNTPSTVGARNQIAVPSPAGTMFYRLLSH